MSAPDLSAALEILADAVAAKVVERLRSGDAPGMVDQAQSGLGRRRHIAFCRRLISAGDRRAVQLGRRYLLTPEAVIEARAFYSRQAKTCRHKQQADDEELARELGLTTRGGDAAA